MGNGLKSILKENSYLYASKNISLAPISPKNVSNHYPELYPRKEKMLRIVFGTFYGRFEPNLSEIKPPLSKGQ